MRIFTLLVVCIFLSSCSAEYKMKKEFEKCFKQRMHNPESFELVEFTIVQEAYDWSDENQKFYDSIMTAGIDGYDSFSKTMDSLVAIEELTNEDFIYWKALVETRGKIGFGAIITSHHLALYNHFDNSLKSIDGESCLLALN